jgi:hypothetical protein
MLVFVMPIIVMKQENKGLEQPACAKIRGSKSPERLKMTFIARVIARVIQPPVSINVAKFIDL